MRRIVRSLLALHDRAACAVRAFAADPPALDANGERVATVTPSLADLLERDELRRADIDRRMAELQARIDAERIEHARLTAEQDLEREQAEVETWRHLFEQRRGQGFEAC